MPEIGQKYKCEVNVQGVSGVGCLTFKLTLIDILYDEVGYRQHWKAEYYKRPALFKKNWENAGIFKVFTSEALAGMCVDYVVSLGYDVGFFQQPTVYLWD